MLCLRNISLLFTQFILSTEKIVLLPITDCSNFKLIKLLFSRLIFSSPFLMVSIFHSILYVEFRLTLLFNLPIHVLPITYWILSFCLFFYSSLLFLNVPSAQIFAGPSLYAAYLPRF